MQVAEAQREIRQGYVGGYVGQLVSGVLWLGSAALATWVSTGTGIWFLVLSGFFIFPLTLLGLSTIRQRVTVSRGSPLNGLAMQVAFTLPLVLPVVGAATLYRIEWFYPAFMIVLGAHYLPFVFLYGMRMFAAGGWFTGALLLVFAVLGRWFAVRETTAARAPVSE
ncbi:MAG: hypothetical protein Q8M55_05650 [Actinomycetota bacterium]|nr:hypothetical protein [Actinomycetota bacterium]MDZ4179853.1 hypothetical protein [Coriobacteriia bacterium]